MAIRTMVYCCFSANFNSDYNYSLHNNNAFEIKLQVVDRYGGVTDEHYSSLNIFSFDSHIEYLLIYSRNSPKEIYYTQNFKCFFFRN